MTRQLDIEGAHDFPAAPKGPAPLQPQENADPDRARVWRYIRRHSSRREVAEWVGVSMAWLTKWLRGEVEAEERTTVGRLWRVTRRR